MVFLHGSLYSIPERLLQFDTVRVSATGATTFASILPETGVGLTERDSVQLQRDVFERTAEQGAAVQKRGTMVQIVSADPIACFRIVFRTENVRMPKVIELL